MDRPELEAKEIAELCDTIRAFVNQEKYEQCKKLICKAMEKYPHAPEPHNLFGILLEKEGNHIAAMKHFRAAMALDPTYIPVRFNLENFASFFAVKKYAFNESDCREAKKGKNCVIQYDENGIGHIVKGV